MKIFIKKILIFFVLIVLYFLPTIIFRPNLDYYYNIIKPSYSPAHYIFSIAWGIIYIIFSLFLSHNLVENKLDKEVKVAFILNYIISFFFNYFFFKKNNLFLSFSDTFLSFSSGLLIFLILFKKNRYNALIITPYLLWTAFASILMCHIFFLN